MTGSPRKSYFGLLMLAFATVSTAATIRGRVIADDMPGGVPGVNVVVYKDTVATGMGAATDAAGSFVISALPAGKYTIHFDYLGYASVVRDVSLAEDADLSLSVHLRPEAVVGQEVVVTASVTRHEVSISNTPVRVEVMVPEELQDKISFSASVDGALRYSGGIVVNASRHLYEAENVRLRGIDSRYLLLLTDQAPVLGYQPEEVGLWSVPLVGIRQLEIVKGDYSALYGLGQAGVINAALRTPFTDSLGFFGLARSNFQDDQYAGFYAGRKSGPWGLSGIFSGEDINPSHSSRNRRYVVLPRLDYHSVSSQAFISGALLGSRYATDKILLDRQALSAGLEFPITDESKVQFQAQYADQVRGYLPDPESIKAHSGLSYVMGQFVHSAGSLTSIAGVDGLGDKWEMSGLNSGTWATESRWALFLQEEWAINKNWSVLYGGRLTRAQIESAGPFAYQDSSGEAQTGEASAVQWVTHQMVSLLWKPGYFTSCRLAGSYGSIPAPSHFVQPYLDSLRIFVPSSGSNLERYWNVSFDLRRVSRLAGWGWTNDVSLFVTGLDHHLDVYAAQSQSELRLGSRYLIPGAELFSRLDIGEDAALLLGYTFLYPNDAYETSPGTMLPLPRHQANFELDWEIEGTGVRLELEGKFVSRQETPGNLFRSSAPPYGLAGATLEYSLGPAKLFGGVENAADFRQSDTGPLWGPRQGREFYLGLKALL